MSSRVPSSNRAYRTVSPGSRTTMYAPSLCWRGMRTTTVCCAKSAPLTYTNDPRWRRLGPATSLERSPACRNSLGRPHPLRTPSPRTHRMNHMPKPQPRATLRIHSPGPSPTCTSTYQLSSTESAPASPFLPAGWSTYVDLPAFGLRARRLRPADGIVHRLPLDGREGNFRRLGTALGQAVTRYHPGIAGSASTFPESPTRRRGAAPLPWGRPSAIRWSFPASRQLHVGAQTFRHLLKDLCK